MKKSLYTLASHEDLDGRLASAIARAVFVALGIAMTAAALDPTELQPTGKLEPGTFELQQKIEYEQNDESEFVSETSIEYEFTEKWALRLLIPVDAPEDEGAEPGNTGIRLKHVFNPHTESGPIVALTAEAALPTGEDSRGVGGDLRLRFTQGIGGPDAKHKLHLTLKGKYDAGAESHERDSRYEAVAGYTFDVSPRTTLIADVVRKQLKADGANANIVELGVKHAIGDAMTIGAGAGVGFGEQSPDFSAQAGIQFRLGRR
jgi:hypothetical protein